MGVAGSVVVDVMTDHTMAHVDDGVQIGDAPSAGLHVSATDTTSILSLAGALAIGGTAGVGAGVDVEVVNKDTEAWIAGTVNATLSGDVSVDATSSESVTSIAVGGGFAGTAAVNVNVARLGLLGHDRRLHRRRRDRARGRQRPGLGDRVAQR